MYYKFDSSQMPYTLLNVPFKQKDTAKIYGARWNPDKKSWYCDFMTCRKKGECTQENYYTLIHLF